MGGYGLIGHPLGHSISPLIHQLRSEYPYDLIDLDPQSFDNQARHLISQLDGFNVTVPYKEWIMGFLKGVDKTAALVGAVNTVCNGVGYNTDVTGFERDFAQVMKVHKVDRAVIVGAGGVAHAIAAGLVRCHISEITLCVRDNPVSLEKGRALAEKISSWGKALGKGVDEILPDVSVVTESQLICKQNTVLINATPQGMYPAVKTLPLTRGFLENLFQSGCVSVVYDAIYNPLVTQLMLVAQGCGVPAYNGLNMLINQAQDAQEIWGSVREGQAQHDEQGQMQPARSLTEEEERCVSRERYPGLGRNLAPSQGVSYRSLITRCKKHLLEAHPQIYVLTGFMGAGKSSVLRELATRFASEVICIDLDDAVEQQCNCTIAEIFKSQGEAAFRSIEQETLTQLVEGASTTTIIAAGGGTLVQPWAQEFIDQHSLRVIHLDVDCDIAYQRIVAQEDALTRISNEGAERGATEEVTTPRAQHVRPLATSFEDLQQHYNQRDSLYREAADLIVNANRPTHEVVQSVYQSICADENLCSLDMRQIDFRFLASKNTQVVCGHGCIDTFVDILAYALPLSWYQSLMRNNAQALIVADDNTAPFAQRISDQLQACGVSATVSIMAPGECGKELESVVKLWDQCAQLQLTRSDIVISCGGGVVSDVAGFVASTFKRGVGLINVPTTLTSAVDACLGGKTGFNYQGYKNQIGTYFEPLAVVIDCTTFSSLSPREVRCGLGEIIKYHVIDPSKMPYELVHTLIQELQTQDFTNDVVQAVIRSLALKQELVDQDTYDRGLRKLLNAGHTFGHAIEAATNYEEFSHGEAVVLGLVCELELAQARAMQASTDTGVAELRNNANVAEDQKPSEGQQDIQERQCAEKRPYAENHPHSISQVLQRVVDLAHQGGFKLKTSACIDDVMQAMTADKKRENNTIQMITIDSQGKAALENWDIDKIGHAAQAYLADYVKR